ncbi:MAG: tRNA(Ile)-lysidine synthase [Mycoplasmataceae bacterium]|nr:MAG: tRNA(Ile)-lysidine synthase [Mycoplasmataceae bacterium]
MIHEIFKENFWKGKKKYILAVSGGSDSMFLLDKMRQKEYDFVVAHVNYRKRQDSDFDERLVRDYCQKYSLNFEVKSVKETEYSPKINFQAQARKIRYDFFQELATKHQSKHIVIAHHYDDSLETYLLQKKRKSIVDYWGLPTKVKLGKFWILRPLLLLNKSYICQYLSEKKITYANDITNQLAIYQRNIVRQELNNLSEERKKELKEEIDKKNQELKEVKKKVREIAKKLIVSRYVFQLCKKNQYSSEIYLRFVYYWINQATNGLLQQKKKQILKEIYKQLFISKKKNLIIKLGNNFHIIKGNNQVLISPIKILL